MFAKFKNWVGLGSNAEEYEYYEDNTPHDKEETLHNEKETIHYEEETSHNEEETSHSIPIISASIPTTTPVSPPAPASAPVIDWSLNPDKEAVYNHLIVQDKKASLRLAKARDLGEKLDLINGRSERVLGKISSIISEEESNSLKETILNNDLFVIGSFLGVDSSEEPSSDSEEPSSEEPSEVIVDPFGGICY